MHAHTIEHPNAPTHHTHTHVHAHS